MAAAWRNSRQSRVACSLSNTTIRPFLSAPIIRSTMKTTKSRWIILLLIQASLLLIHYSNCDDDNQEDSSTNSVLHDLEMSNNTTGICYKNYFFLIQYII